MRTLAILLVFSAACGEDPVRFPYGTPPDIPVKSPPPEQSIAKECIATSDCSSGTWCDPTVFGCVAVLGQNATLPLDTVHDGQCDAALAATVCASGVCENADNACGWATGTSGCSNGIDARCRSGLCGTSGSCLTPGSCDLDTDCASGTWCNFSTHLCAARVSNGALLPVDGSHLDGTCSPAAAALVCASGVCDTDNSCGFAQAGGACSPGPDARCRSNTCSTDGACGLASAEGVCTPGNDRKCRSGVCSVDTTCIATGTCNLAADCASAQFCDPDLAVCATKIVNGGLLPASIVCTTLDAAAYCASAVCDVDGRCGLTDGGVPCASASQCRGAICGVDSKCGQPDIAGPCSAAGANSECRSGLCSHDSFCAPSGGCNIDADCNAWCDISAHSCSTKVVNGGALPVDASHESPVLDGTCSAQVGALVCASGACDSDNLCGLANGTTGCTADPTVCRAAACSTSNTCGLPDGDVCSSNGNCVSGLCGVGNTCEPACGTFGGACCAGSTCGIGLSCNAQNTCGCVGSGFQCGSSCCDAGKYCGAGDTCIDIDNTSCLPFESTALGTVCNNGECPATCKAIKSTTPAAASGLYYIDPDGVGPNQPFQARCDMTYDGGGWTLIGYEPTGAPSPSDLTGAMAYLWQSTGVDTDLATSGATAAFIGPRFTFTTHYTAARFNFCDAADAGQKNRFLRFTTSQELFADEAKRGSIDNEIALSSFTTNDAALSDLIHTPNDAHFCRAATSTDKWGDTSWAIKGTDEYFECGCNSGGWTGQGAYYGGTGSLNGVAQCTECGCSGGGWSGTVGDGGTKGGQTNNTLYFWIK